MDSHNSTTTLTKCKKCAHYTDVLKGAIVGSLNLDEAWYIQGINFDDEDRSMHIYVSAQKDARFLCPQCDSATTRYGYENTERIWRHGDCFFCLSYVHCRRPRVCCPHCGVMQINAPFERKNSRFTLSFEGYVMLILADMPRAKAAEALRCDEKSLASILSYWVDKAVNDRTLEDTRKLAIDETSFRRGHSYVTLVIDAEKRCVIDVEKGRDRSAIAAFADKLEEHGGACQAITTVTSDMSKSYLPAIAKKFHNAVNVIDKFHVKKILIEALDKVRKNEQKQTLNKQELFRGRRLFMIPQERLTLEQGEKLVSLSKVYPQTGRASRIVAALDDFYNCRTQDEAEHTFEKLYSWMRHCRLEPMKKAAESLMRHKNNILAYFEERITNAICEGINSIIQAAKRKARGFHTFEGYAAMIYLVAGKLELAVSRPF